MKTFGAFGVSSTSSSFLGAFFGWHSSCSLSQSSARLLRRLRALSFSTSACFSSSYFLSLDFCLCRMGGVFGLVGDLALALPVCEITEVSLPPWPLSFSFISSLVLLDYYLTVFGSFLPRSGFFSASAAFFFSFTFSSG